MDSKAVLFTPLFDSETASFLVSKSSGPFAEMKLMDFFFRVPPNNMLRELRESRDSS